VTVPRKSVDRRVTFQAYGRAALRPVFDRIGWDAAAGEPADRTLLRERLMRGLAMFLIIGFDGAMGALAEMLRGKGLGAGAVGTFLGTQFSHVPWKVFTSMMSSFRSSFSLLAFLSCFRCLRSSSVGASARRICASCGGLFSFTAWA
jgi:hypothetical protein